MKYEEFDEMLKIDALRLDRTYWITDYRFNNIHNKPSRHIAPIEVMVFKVSENNELRRTYRNSSYYFKPLGISSQPLSKNILPFTHYSDKSIHVFLSEQNARSFYEERCLEALTLAAEARAEFESKFMTIEDSIRENMDLHKPSLNHD